MFCSRMHKLRIFFGFRLFWVCMAVHILNCSIDAPDARPDFAPEDLSVNEMESFTELVLEKVLNFPTAMPEQDDDDYGDQLEFKLSKFVLDLGWTFGNRPLFVNAFYFPPGFRLDQGFYQAHIVEVAPPPTWG